MIRWKQVLVALAVTLAGISGCKQQCFLYECDHEHYCRDIGLPDREECDPSAPNETITPNIPPPSNVNDPERRPRYLTMAEAVAIALEQGRVQPITPILTSLNPTIPAATLQDFLSSAPGATGASAVNLSQSIRVLRLEPAFRGSDIDGSLAKFDAQWSTSVQWSNTDSPFAGTSLNAFQPNAQNAAVRTSFLKPLPTGGVAGITFDTNYRLLTPTSQNPINLNTYTTDLQFRFEQPLLQGYGIEINQIRPSHPGSVLGGLVDYSGLSRTEGILISRLRFDQARSNFEDLVQTMVLNVKISYWSLYNSYWNLYSREQALRQAFEAWKINKARFEAGRIPVQDFAQTRQQYELFRSQRLAALSDVLERERVLRELMGMPVEDCTRLVPIDEPTLTPYQPDWCTALNEAMALRPPLISQREELKARLFDVMLQKNYLLPDLRFTSTYGLSGLGSRLDGGDDNAFRSLASDRFTNYSFGLQFAYPLGYRVAHANLRRSRLALAQQYMVLRDYEGKVQHFLAQQYRALFDNHAQIEINRSQRVAAAEQLEARFKQYLAGAGTLDILLESQRVWADALQNEYTAIASYNIYLARFEYAKGTILQDENIHISEGPLPCCAQERAVEHLKERTKALILRQRAEPATSACCSAGGPGIVPQVPENVAPPVSTLPFMQQNPPRLPETEKLPPPRPSGSGSLDNDPARMSPLNPSGVAPVTELRIAPLPVDLSSDPQPQFKGSPYRPR